MLQDVGFDHRSMCHGLQSHRGKFLGPNKCMKSSHDGNSQNQLLLTPGLIGMSDSNHTSAPESLNFCEFGDGSCISPEENKNCRQSYHTLCTPWIQLDPSLNHMNGT